VSAALDHLVVMAASLAVTAIWLIWVNRPH